MSPTCTCNHCPSLLGRGKNLGTHEGWHLGALVTPAPSRQLQLLHITCLGGPCDNMSLHSWLSSLPLVTGESTTAREVGKCYLAPKSPSYDQNPGKKQNAKNPSSEHCLEGSYAHHYTTNAVLNIVWRQISNSRRMDVCTVVQLTSGKLFHL